ncbi:DNA repair protein RAD51-like protein 4-like [Iris pallida]|uniref:DNA repair protein RAD51-like protein 4-like n=1 Tax=Iris pallida TaxID=29817 RepID=A0AAX6FDW3_IRIPA|nr:DNA repair protein RAD51-like protein 4-like [Iris pallida]
MPPLEKLEPEFPIIDADFRRFCASLGIFSVEDFLVHDVSKVVALAESKATSKVLKEGIAQILSIIDGQHQPWLNGVDLLNNTTQNKHFLPTGCEGIDMLLGGGMREGQLTEIAGPSSSGKTQLCLYVGSHVADKHMGGVLFLDTCNSFSPRRIACIVSQFSNSSIREVKELRLKRIMSGIFSQSIYDIFALLDVLHQLEFKLNHKVTSETANVCLLIIDSISSLITPILGGNSSQGRLMMVSAGYVLKKLANEHNLAVLVTNHMVGGEGGILKPALGESWKSIPHVRLLLSRDQGSRLCNISVLKHTSVASGRAAEFLITDGAA